MHQILDKFFRKKNKKNSKLPFSLFTCNSFDVCIPEKKRQNCILNEA